MENLSYWKTMRQGFGLACLFALGILARTRLHDLNTDLTLWVIPWYDYIQQHGIRVALGNTFSDYTPPYTYLLAVMTLIPLPKVVAIKLISIAMDGLNAFTIYKIVRSKFTSGLVPLWAAGIFLCLPTVFINSAFWGESDSVYTSFLLIALYFFLSQKPVWGMLAFSVSFAIKAQAVFMAPFLAVLFLRGFVSHLKNPARALPHEPFFTKRIAPWHFFMVPGVYVLLCLPVILLGRDWVNVLTIYFMQGNYFRALSAYAPNFYIFIPNTYYAPVLLIGLILTALSLGVWVIVTALDRHPIHPERLVLLALISVALTPFLLPKMHERYFYAADVFSLVLAFFSPELWFLPIIYQFISGLSYTVFLLGFPILPVFIGAIINGATIIFLLRQQFQNPSRASG